MTTILVDKKGLKQYYDELDRLNTLYLSSSNSASTSYASAVGDGWHDNFDFEESIRELRKIKTRINNMKEEEPYLKLVPNEKLNSNIININDIIKIRLIYAKDDYEDLTIKLTDNYLPTKNDNYEEITLNSIMGKTIYKKDIKDNIYYTVNDNKIVIQILEKESDNNE